MRHDFMRIVEEGFDPSDANQAMQLAYASADLLRYVNAAIEHDADGMRIGRDIARELGVRMDRVATLIDWRLTDDLAHYRELLRL